MEFLLFGARKPLNKKLVPTRALGCTTWDNMGVIHVVCMIEMGMWQKCAASKVGRRTINMEEAKDMDNILVCTCNFKKNFERGLQTWYGRMVLLIGRRSGGASESRFPTTQSAWTIHPIACARAPTRALSPSQPFSSFTKTSRKLETRASPSHTPHKLSNLETPLFELETALEVGHVLVGSPRNNLSSSWVSRKLQCSMF